jgi:hypothetical protein
MCRHEAAEALGALGFDGSLELLKARRDDKEELEVVRETAELAVERIEWAASEAGKAEKLRTRYVFRGRIFLGSGFLVEGLLETGRSKTGSLDARLLNVQLTSSETATSHLSTLRLRSRRPLRLLPSRSSKRPSSTHLSRCSSVTGPCLRSATSLRRPTFQLPSQPCMPSHAACTTHLRFSVTRSHSSSASCATPHPCPV